MRRTTAAAVTAVALILGIVALTLPNNPSTTPTKGDTMAQPGILSSQIPKGEDWIPREIADLKRDLRELGPSIMHSVQGIVDDLTAQQATLTTTVANLTTDEATLATTVSGLSTAQAGIAANVADINTLITQVVKSQSVYATISNFTLTGVHPVPNPIAVIKTVTITVPAGFTTANVTVLSRVFAYNNNTTGGTNTQGADYLFCQTGIAGTYDYALGLSVGGFGGSNVTFSPLAKVLTGLTPGSTFTITLGAASDYLDWTQTGNVATMSGDIVWSR